MISIRPAGNKDMEVLADFQKRLAHETEINSLYISVLSAGIRALLSDPSKGVYYVAEDGDRTVGCFLITYEWSDWRNGLIWWLQSVYVAADARKKGVFKAMHEFIRQGIASDPGILGLRLYVDKTNTRAQQVYQSLGMDGDHYTVFEWLKGANS